MSAARSTREPSGGRFSWLRARRDRPRRWSRLTREGKVFVFVTVGVGIAAVNTGQNLLYLMLGLMLSLLLLSMVLSENALDRLRVSRKLPKRAFAKTPCAIELELANDKRWLPSYSLEVEDRAENERTDRRCFFLKVGAKDAQRASYRRVPSRRGLLTLSGYRILTRYPFGLVEKARIHPREDTLLVYPAVVPVDPKLLGSLRVGAEVPTQKPGAGTEISGLRDYVDGDEARNIHWRRSAALDRLVVRERDRDAASRITLVLDEARPDDANEAWDEAFEHAVSETASLALAALGRGIAVEVVTRTRRTPIVLPGARADAILTMLALLEAVSPSDAATPPLPRGDHLVVAISAGGAVAARGAA